MAYGLGFSFWTLNVKPAQGMASGLAVGLRVLGFQGEVRSINPKP